MGHLFWESLEADSKQFNWTPKSVTDVLLDGVIKVTTKPVYATDLACQAFHAVVMSLYGPNGTYLELA